MAKRFGRNQKNRFRNQIKNPETQPCFAGKEASYWEGHALQCAKQLKTLTDTFDLCPPGV